MEARSCLVHPDQLMAAYYLRDIVAQRLMATSWRRRRRCSRNSPTPVGGALHGRIVALRAEVGEATVLR